MKLQNEQMWSQESIEVIKGNANFMFDEFQGWTFKGEKEDPV